MMPLGSTGSSEDEDNILVHCMEIGGTRRSLDADRISEVEFTKIRDIWGGVEGQIRGSSLKFRFGMRCAVAQVPLELKSMSWGSLSCS